MKEIPYCVPDVSPANRLSFPDHSPPIAIIHHQRRYLSIPQKMLPCLERVRFNYHPKDYVLHSG